MRRPGSVDDGRGAAARMRAVGARLSDERGFTLIEVVIAASLMVIVVIATLSVLDAFNSNAVANQARNDAQDSARNTLDLLTRQLRNLASPTFDRPQAIDVAGPYDLVFQTVDSNAPPNGSSNSANIKRVRYCVSASGKLYSEQQTWTSASTPASPSTLGSPCPYGAPYSSQRLLATNVSNQTGSRPLFTFTPTSWTTGSPTSQIYGITATIYITTAGVHSHEISLSSGVYLRNQNQAPTASFSYSVNAGSIALDGSASSDPEGQPLTYAWTDNGTAISGCSSVVCYDPVTQGSSHTITLTVTDPGSLTGTSTQQVSA